MTLQAVQTERIYGWYDRADQPIDQPTFNPSFSAPCLFCGEPISDLDVRTHSIMPLGSNRSYFYRTHRTCHEVAPSAQRDAIDSVVLDSIKHNND